MALNAITTIADMQIVPEKFSTYVTEKTTAARMRYPSAALRPPTAALPC